MCGYINANLQPILLDLALNGADAVASSIHACAAFAAIKMHCCLRAMSERGAAGRSTQRATARAPPGRSRRALGRGGGPLDCSRLAMAVLARVQDYVTCACMRCWQAASEPSAPACVTRGDAHEAEALTAADAEVLVTAAFQRVLRRKHGTYGAALRCLAAGLRKRRLQSAAARWRAVITPAERLPPDLRHLRW